MYNTISCIILSAGYSSRMHKCHKALLHFEEENKREFMLEKVVNTFKSACISNVYVVLGHEEERIRSSLKDLDCNFIVNNNYDKGMFSSVVAGLCALDSSVEASFILPVDAALIKSSTIKKMLEYRETSILEKKNKAVYIPTFLEKCGHPPLIEKEHFAPIIHLQKYENNPEFRGLKGYFSSLFTSDEEELKSCFLNSRDPYFIKENNSKLAFVPLCDAGIVSDIDDEEQYEKALNFLSETKNRKNPDIYEAFHLLIYAQLPRRTKRHICKVALGALRLGFHLSKALKIEFSLLNCICGGLLHDICRTQRKHAKVGSEYLKTFSWYTLSAIVASHTNLPKEVLKKIDIDFEEALESEDVASLVDDVDFLYPAICVHLADKFYNSEQHITLEQRHENIRQRCSDDVLALEMIAKREKLSLKVKSYFDLTCGLDAYICVEKMCDHEYESKMFELEKKFNTYFSGD